MALVRAFEDARKDQIRRGEDGRDANGGIISTRFFGSRDNPDFPDAKLAHHDRGEVTRPHFHIVDQFQVIVEGKGKIGRHDYIPYSVHFSRAYTPYGPLLADADTGFKHFGLRPHYDPGSQRLPQALDKLKQIPDRQPWQITCPVTFPAFQLDTTAAGTMLVAVPNMKDEQGLAAYTLSMKPNAKTYAPDPSLGNGQYLVVLKGSLLHDDREHKAWALAFVGSTEGPFRIRAGAQGLEALILNFPLRRAPTTNATPSLRTATGLKT